MKRFIKTITACIVAAGLSSCALIDFVPQGYVFSYGVSDYPGTANDLNFTDDDARSIYTMFNVAGYESHLRVNGGGGTYGGTEEAPATLMQLEADIAYAAERATTKDTIVFYFSSHGTQIQNTSDSEDDEPTDPEGSLFSGQAADEYVLLYYPTWELDTDPESVYLSDNTLQLLLSSIPHGKIVVIIDACYSGGFIGDSNYLDIWDDPYYQGDGDSYTVPDIDDLISSWSHSLAGYDVKAETALVLAAAGEYEESQEFYDSDQYPDQGIFTYYLLETPEKGDIDGDGYVSLFEMYEYVSYKLRKNWNDPNPVKSFHPRITGSAVDFFLF